jgi:hypothetical protein
MPLTPPASPTVFYVVIGTNAASGLQQNETSAVSWTSSNTAVATVNNGGGVTLVGQGSTTITAQYTNAATAGTPLNGDGELDSERRSGGASPVHFDPAGFGIGWISGPNQSTDRDRDFL